MVNSTSISATLGARNDALHERVEDDYYASNPKAAEYLLSVESFSNIWECAVGGGHLAEIFKSKGSLSRCSDIIDRGYPNTEIIDFLQFNEKWRGDIITNPPFQFAINFMKKGLEVIEEGNKLALFLPVRYLTGKARGKVFVEHPPKSVHVSSCTVSLKCARNGDFGLKTTSGASEYMWVVWQKGFTGNTSLNWFNG